MKQKPKAVRATENTKQMAEKEIEQGIFPE